LELEYAADFVYYKSLTGIFNISQESQQKSKLYMIKMKKIRILWPEMTLEDESGVNIPGSM